MSRKQRNHLFSPKQRNIIKAQ